MKDAFTSTLACLCLPIKKDRNCMNITTDECLSGSYLLSSRGPRGAPASAAAVGWLRVWKALVEQCSCLGGEGGGEPKKTDATIRAGDSKDRIGEKKPSDRFEIRSKSVTGRAGGRFLAGGGRVGVAAWLAGLLQGALRAHGFH